MPNPVKNLRYIKWYNSSSLRPIKSLINSMRYNWRQSAVYQDNLKLYWKSDKTPYFLRWLKSILSRCFSKILLTTEKGLTGWCFNQWTFPNFLQYRDHRWDIQKPRKQDSFRHILESSTSMYKNSDSDLLRATTEIKSGPFNVIYMSRLVMTFSSN